MSENVVTTFRSWEPATIALASGQPIQIKVKRLDVGEAQFFERLFRRAMSRESERVLFVRRPGEEQERDVRSAISEEDFGRFQITASEFRAAIERKDTVGAPVVLEALEGLLKTISPTERFVMSAADIRSRRLLGFTSTEREAYEKLREEDDRAFETCARHALENFVRVHAGQFQWEDVETGEVRPVTTGTDLARCLGSDGNAVLAVLFAIRQKNTLSAEEKKTSQSPSTSTPSSSASSPIAPGDAPAAIATDAAPSASATTVAATPTAPTTSGAMA